jgi:hypothetical protein
MLDRESEAGPMEAAIERATKLTGDEAEKPRRPFGFQPGRSGNPSGNRYLKDQAAALFETMSGDLGPLTKTDEILLQQACLMLAKASRISGRDRQNVDVAVRLHSEARRTITSLRRRVAKVPGSPGLDEYLTARAERAAVTAERPVIVAPREIPADTETRTSGHGNGAAVPSSEDLP